MARAHHALLVLAILLAGCAPFQPQRVPAPGGGVGDAGTRAAQLAMAQVGAPYRYGGADPAQGFDCSGLVAYVFGQQGIQVPRTAAQQFAAARPVDAAELRPGDLVFFRPAPAGGGVGHVGIYTGQGRFVHAPESGKRVAEASLGDDYYRDRLAGYGRLAAPYPPTAAHSALR